MNLIKWEDMRVGDKVVFRGYSNSSHDHWGFIEGQVYTVGTRFGRVGPVSSSGEIPIKNWGFLFERVVYGSVVDDFKTLVEGEELVFEGFSNEDHKHWCYTVGEVYKVGRDASGLHGKIGPIAENGNVPSRNWGFIFKRVSGNVEKLLQKSHRESTVNTLTRHLRT